MPTISKHQNIIFKPTASLRHLRLQSPKRFAYQMHACALAPTRTELEHDLKNMYSIQ